MKNVFTLSVAAASVVTAMLPQLANAHGWADYPKARQVICNEDGGYWGSADGSTIPNEACRAAFLESGTYPFIQTNEFASLVPNHTDMDAVKNTVKDGLICAGGDTKKSGMAVASANWQRTEMKAGETFTFRYRATAPHNPSYWQFYMTKPGYDAAHGRITWDDLELFDTAGNIAVTQENDGKYYHIELTLPADRVGDATLVSRWQREDPAGEGFYNCSDIRFDGEVQPAEWTSKGAYVKPGITAEQGDSVWFRIFSAQGNEIAFEKLAITAANEDVHAWSYDLAELVNAKYPTITKVGIQQASGEIAYNAADLYANQVFVTNGDYSYALDVRDAVVEPAPVMVDGLKPEYSLAGGSAAIAATVRSEGQYIINMSLLDASGTPVSLASEMINNGSASLEVVAAKAGEYTVEVTAMVKGSHEAKVVASQAVTVKAESTGGGEYDFEYPQGVGSYVPGETVVLGRDGNTYQCRPFPEGGWCNIDSAAHYEPGFGSAWKDAWIKQ